jgi:hypothetical protein
MSYCHGWKFQFGEKKINQTQPTEIKMDEVIHYLEDYQALKNNN